MSLESAQQGRASRDECRVATVTEKTLENAIIGEVYFTGADGAFGAVMRLDGTLPPPLDNTSLAQLTFCVLRLDNGFTVVGVNHGPAGKVGFDAEYGRRDARNDAVRQALPFLGFRLADEQAKPVLTAKDAEADLLGKPRPELRVTAVAGHAEPRCAESNPIDDAVNEVRAAISSYDAACELATRAQQLATETGDALDKELKGLREARSRLDGLVGHAKNSMGRRS